MLYPICTREMASYSPIDLAEFRRPSMFSSLIWSINSGVVTVLCRPGRSETQGEKSPCLISATELLTAAFNFVYSHNVSIRMAWISLSFFVFRKKSDESSRLEVVEIERVVCVFPNSFCNKKKCNSALEQMPLFKNIIDKVIRHREVCRSKDI